MGSDIKLGNPWADKELGHGVQTCLILFYFELLGGSLVLLPVLCSFSVGQEHISQLRLETRSDHIIKLCDFNGCYQMSNSQH